MRFYNEVMHLLDEMEWQNRINPDKESLIRSQGYKTFSMLDSAKQEFLNAYKYKNAKKFSIFQAQISQECYFSRSKILKCKQLLIF